MRSSKCILLLLFCSVISIILYSQHFFTAELSTIERNIEIVQNHHILQSRKVVDTQTKINKVPLLLWKFTLADTHEKKMYITNQLLEQIQQIEDDQLLAFDGDEDEIVLSNYVQKNWLGYKQLVLKTMDATSNNDISSAQEAMTLSLIYLERVNTGMKMIVDFHQNDVSQKTANIAVTAQSSQQNILGFSIVAIISFLFIVFFTFRKIILTENQLRKQVSELAEKNALLAEKNLRIKQLAYEDNLTGLANRYAFQSVLTKELAAVSSNATNGAVIFFDIDGFKQVNDVYGHAIGDELLAVIGARIKPLLDDKISFGARFGGDEFALFFKEVTAKDISPILDKLLEVVFIPTEIQDITFHPTASIGVAFYPQQGTTAAELLKKADKAMYQAKAKKNAYVLYNEEARIINPG
ncbi:diguanylate cyclase domain-containing protein [Sporomusa malonica]|uniref:Diguanylate cyclase (GGDEF) domain-containing protein n=1 Tax=Sporomusa malonica TaxID=112901 RepID=A0A1W1ZUQ1_9FIRM|nr:diguanylate cyclase [Sporomusa malonica]SMC52169.1 diguanylate cyclase (GGDEF) domain-containing protein [Sporomusa malonica]